MSRSITGIQLSGRHAWPDSQSNAARAYAREPTEEKLAVLKSTERRAAGELSALQVRLGFSYVTDGGFGFKDDFLPYIERVPWIGGGEGRISQHPGARNLYYFIPLVNERLERQPDGAVLEGYIMPDAIPRPARRKLTLASPLALALASETKVYADTSDLLYAFAEIQRRELQRLAPKYDYVQLNESFAADGRFSERVTRDVVSAFRASLDRIFDGLQVRSAVYFSAGDSARLVQAALDTKLTDVGFDFNTPYRALEGIFDKNLLLGLQNVNRKLPEELLAAEPAQLAQRVKGAIAAMQVSDRSDIFLTQSQGSDGLQTYPQALRRDENLSAAAVLLRGD